MKLLWSSATLAGAVKVITTDNFLDADGDIMIPSDDPIYDLNAHGDLTIPSDEPAVKPQAVVAPVPVAEPTVTGLTQSMCQEFAGSIYHDPPVTCDYHTYSQGKLAEDGSDIAAQVEQEQGLDTVHACT